MHLSDHSLSQLDEADVQALDEGRLRGLSLRLLEDLKEARDRLRQNPANSARPPSSRAPWERRSTQDEDEADTDATTPVEDEYVPSAEASPSPAEPPATTDANASAPDAVGSETSKPKRTAGKQPGAPGIGRTQVLTAQETAIHRPSVCAACAEALPGDAPSVADAGFQSVDLVWGDPAQPGLHLRVTDHRVHDTGCGCGHRTRARPGEGLVEEPCLAPVALSEWRLVGPGLATLFVALHLRCRLSRPRMRECLYDWFGVRLSVGTLDRTLREAAAATAPLEEKLNAAVVASDLLYADETSWSQGAELLWLWVFTSATVALFVVAKRGREVLDRILPGFAGWLMSDGWQAYRHLPQRLRCWAHLTRKAQGLIDRFDREAQAFGRQVQSAFDTLIGAIHAAREGPPGNLLRRHAELQAACVCSGTGSPRRAPWRWNCGTTGTPSFGCWKIPSGRSRTTKPSGRCATGWIARRLMMWERGYAGSSVFTLLASVIETCRKRGHVPWPYLASVSPERRAGRAAAPLLGH